MTINSKFEVNADVGPGESEEIEITWTANEPTPEVSQTIANGNSVTGAEMGQSIKNLNVQLNNLRADIEALRLKANE
jgi:polygalacturonase